MNKPNSEANNLSRAGDDAADRVMGLAGRKDCGCVCMVAVDDGNVERRREFYRDAADAAMTVERVTIEQVRTMLTFCKCGARTEGTRQHATESAER